MAAGAAAQVAEPPRFEIRRFVFDGATLVPRVRLEAATAPFTGPARDFGDVQRALEAVERLYGAAGYSAVQVLLPEQELERGEIRLRVLEARLGRVIVEGNRHFDEANVRASLPALAPGAAPNVVAIGRDLRVANENPSKRATVLLRGGTEEATVDAVVRVSDEPPLARRATLDNSGTRGTGRPRLGLALQHANAAGGDEVLRLHATAGERALIAAAGLRIPLYGAGGALELLAADADVDAGRAGELFEATGAGRVYGLRYVHHLEPAGGYEHRLALGAEYRDYEAPAVSVRPLSLAYRARVLRADGDTVFSAGAWRNASDPEYSRWRWSLEDRRALPGDWQLRLGLSGQLTRDTLVPGERFGLGGADSVRGFEERALTDDKGYRGTIEVHTPDFGARALVFCDWGAVRRTRPAPGDPPARSIASVGLGLRLARGAGLTFRADWGRVVDAGGPGGPARGDNRAHASLSYVF